MITQDQLAAHAAWLRKAPGGARINITRADLSDVILPNANLTRAKLSHLCAVNADLTGTDLSHADLTGADMLYADLTGCNLYRTNLYRANFHGANLAGVNLFRADLALASGLVDAGTDAYSHRFVGVRQDDGWRIAADQQWQTLPEAREHWRNNRDAQARLDVIEANT